MERLRYDKIHESGTLVMPGPVTLQDADDKDGIALLAKEEKKSGG
jgi:hypothetical protein